MRRSALLLFGFASLISPVLEARDASPPDYLFEAVSNSGEPLDAFILRAAPALNSYTKKSGFEACGVIASDAKTGRFAVRINSTKGAMSCGMFRSNVPDGFVATDMTVHSHPERRIVMPTAGDVAYFEAHPIGTRMVKQGRPENLGNALFSSTDYRSGPGYLVSKGRLWFQAGPDSDREIGTVAE